MLGHTAGPFWAAAAVAVLCVVVFELATRNIPP